MKPNRRLLLIVIFLIFDVGISDFAYSRYINDSYRIADAFIRKYYTVTEEKNQRLVINKATESDLEKSAKELNTEYGHFFTDKAYDVLAANRVLLGINMLTNNRAESVRVDKLELTIKESDENRKVYNYSVDISITLVDSSVVSNITKVGEVRAVKSGTK